VLVLASLAAALVTAMLGVVRLVTATDRGLTSPETMVPFLLALGACCVAGLTIRRHPTAAWLAAIAALSIVTFDLAGVGRVARPTMDDEAWGWLSIAIGVSAVMAAGAAVAYAAEWPRRLGRWVVGIGVGALVWMVGVGAWALGSPDATVPALGDPSPLGSLALVTRSFLVIVIAFVGLGLLGDVRPSAARAHRQVEITRDPPRSLRERLAWTIAWIRATAAELAPGHGRADQAARSERSRIARELHAEVVPAIRHALAEAERGGSVERLAGALHDALREVDGLVASRHSIVLEVDGLVAAIGWLAERLEDRSAARVVIDVMDGGDDAAMGEPPCDVAAAAYRVVDLALENVARHAPGASVAVQVAARPTLVRIVVLDDGPGLTVDAERTAVGRGGRGLVDMRAEAAAVGAQLKVGPRSDVRGTAVDFAWPAHERSR
jgi:signal transduction histidine kinase